MRRMNHLVELQFQLWVMQTQLRLLKQNRTSFVYPEMTKGTTAATRV